MDWQNVINSLQEYGWMLLKQHLFLVFVSLAIATVIAIPLGIIMTRGTLRKYMSQILAVLNTAQGIPSLAVVAIFLPIMGIGVVPSIFALTIYALLPMARNTIAGIEDIDPDILEAARGMGMPAKKVFWKVEFPLALPVIIAGMQTAAVLTVGTAAIAQLIGGGGLGRLIFTGINHFKPALTLTGSVICAAIAIILDRGLGVINHIISAPYSE